MLAVTTLGLGGAVCAALSSASSLVAIGFDPNRRPRTQSLSEKKQAEKTEEEEEGRGRRKPKVGKTVWDGIQELLRFSV